MNENWLDFERFAVWGLGRSGVAAANLLARRGKDVLASDVGSREELADQIAELDESVRWHLGENRLEEAQVVVVSPGLRPGLPIIKEALAQGLPVISEVDLAFDASQATWVAITGTDGKTTTTSLAGEMIAHSGCETVVAGNIGTALCDVVDEISNDAVVVAELSANQLWSCHHLAVDTAAITNIAEDHLDYFDDFSDYAPAKYRLIELQPDQATAVLPAWDAKIRKALAVHAKKPVYFGAGQHQPDADDGRAVYFDGDRRGWWRDEGQSGQWIDDFFRESELLGVHNQLNAACAAAVARTVGASWEDCAQGLRKFKALAHRMERVATVDGIKFINDSKATNAHASLAGLVDVPGPLVVIAGGRDKGLDLQDWAAKVAECAQEIIVIGEIRERMSALLRRQGASVREAATLEEAVQRAYKQSKPGGTVVLSPACSSYDMFSSYRARGQAFRDAVQALQAR